MTDWIKCSERLPELKPGGKIRQSEPVWVWLAYENQGREAVLESAPRGNIGSIWCVGDEAYYGLDSVSHWMLPGRPEE